MALDLIWPIAVGCLFFIVIKLLFFLLFFWEIGKLVNVCSMFFKKLKSIWSWVALAVFRLDVDWPVMVNSHHSLIYPQCWGLYTWPIFLMLTAWPWRYLNLQPLLPFFSSQIEKLSDMIAGQIFTYCFIWPPQRACKIGRGGVISILQMENLRLQEIKWLA